MNPKTILATCTVLLVIFVGSAAHVAQRTPELTPDQLHAWRLHDQYVGVIAQLDGLEVQRRTLSSDFKHDAKALDPSTAIGYGRDMKLLNERIAEVSKKVTDLEAAWEQKFWGRFGPLKDAREFITDPSTKKKMDKIAFRLTNFAFDPDKPQPATATTTSGLSASTAKAGYWRLLETRSIKYMVNPASGVTSSSFNVSDGSISGTQTITGDEGPATWAGDCTWSVQAPGGLNRLVPGEVLEVSMTVTDRSVPEKVSGWNHGYTGVGGSIRFDMPYLGLGVSHSAASDLVNIGATWQKNATQKGTWTVPKGPGHSEWGGKAALDANFTFGRFERVYEWTTEPYVPGSAQPAPPVPTPSASRFGAVLGQVLNIKEVAGGAVYNGTWTRRAGTDVFDAVWNGAIRDVVEIESVNGSDIVFYRHGNKGRYSGTLSADGSQVVSGTASWYAAGWYWSATVSD